jgi:N-carbamoylputrescine amidase
MLNSRIKVGLVQNACSLDVEANIAAAIRGVREAAAKGANIVCLQELFQSVYFCQIENHKYFDLAEPIPGPATAIFQDLAKELGVVLVASLFERRAPGLYHNTAAIIDADGAFLGKYRKMHIPDDPLFYEKFYFTPGDLGYKVFGTQFGKIGVLICWDQWYPEAARITTLMGADFLVYPTAIGWAKTQDAATNEEQYGAWQTIQRSHAVANGIPVVSVNRTGVEGEMQFWCGSFVANPFGRVTYQAPHLEEEIHVEALDLSGSDRYRTHWPFLRDRRIDSYAPITKRFIDEE